MADSDRLVLAGDIGGTKTQLAVYRAAGGRLLRLFDRRYRTHDFPSLEALCADFLAGRPTPDAFCFGVPGPVIAGRSHATNVAWTIDENALTRSLAGARVRLMNDLEATAYGVLHLDESETALLQRGEHISNANIAVIAAGTGLGEAALIARDGGYYAVASEGGHCDFAPRGAEQAELMNFLAAEFDHASYERALSGPGLFNIYRFLKLRMSDPEPGWLAARLKREDPAAVVSEAALAGNDPRCVRALEIFAAIYGAEAANLALKMLALGGVYLGGGIAAKILPMLESGGFVRAFNDKGRLSAVLSRIEVRVVLNPEAALVGAAHAAAAMLKE